MGVHVMLTVAWVRFRVREPTPLINGPPEDAGPYIWFFLV